jgi:uncharacterized protein YndB with AHSA1/START domain
VIKEIGSRRPEAAAPRPKRRFSMQGGASGPRQPSDGYVSELTTALWRDTGVRAAGAEVVRTSIEVTVEVEIERPLSSVWSYVSDAERIPEWVGEFKEARVITEGPVGVGSVIRYTVEGDRSGTWEIVEWDPPRRVALDGPPLAWAGGRARPRSSQTLAEAGEGRTLLVSRYEPELSGTLVLMRPYLKRWLRRQRQKDAQTLKSILEGGGPE